MQPALALLELDSIAVGIVAGDAMAKRSPVDVLYAGTIHPGRYLVLVAGAVADVEEAMEAGAEVAAGCIVDRMLLPNVHDDVVAAMRGTRRVAEGEALGIIETRTVASLVTAADAGVKGARVRLLEMRLADGLGGKAYLLFGGLLAEVEAAVELGGERAGAAGAAITRVVAQLHPEMRENLEAAPRFRERIAGTMGA
jgi:microcompartment protein CcmL/EutN